jgi:stage II sporulation protein D
VAGPITAVTVDCSRAQRKWPALGGIAALALVAILSLLAAPSVSARSRAGVAATGVTISGHGFGHGVGLSQWGAQQRAAAGQTYRQILSFYYPGATLGRDPAARTVRVLVAERPRLTIGSAAAFTVRDARGRIVRLKAGRYALSADGVLGSAPLAFPLRPRPGAAPLEIGGIPYRGTLSLQEDDGRLQAIDTLALEDYLVGVVSTENPGYWPQDALCAQAIASRTYALSHLRPNADFDLYADDRSQNYHGLQKEFPSAATAVAATRRQILLFGGRPIEAFFSASNGGLTSGVEGVWGGSGLPYLVSRVDPYDARSPAGSWGPVKVSIDRLRSAFTGLPDGIAEVRVSRTDAERAAVVTFVGIDGSSFQVGGRVFQQRLGLRSTYLTVTPTY